MKIAIFESKYSDDDMKAADYECGKLMKLMGAANFKTREINEGDKDSEL